VEGGEGLNETPLKPLRRGLVMDNEKRIRQYRAEVMLDLRRQLDWIMKAIVMDDQEWLDIYADQFAASALNLRSDVMNESLGLEGEVKA
jgi:hypothetical protein